MKRRISWVFLAALVSFTGSVNSRAAGSYFETAWVNEGNSQSLKAWNLADLELLHKTSKTEKDPSDGKSAHWRGVLLSEVLEKSLATLPPEQKAQVDLLVFKSAEGTEIVVPRWLITKYPLLVAYEKDKASLSAPELVLPISSEPKILKENFPIENLFLSKATRLELTSYKSKFSSFFLTSRTDPAAVRGEKLFLQGCTGCHAASDSAKPSMATQTLTMKELSSEVRSRTLASTGHPLMEKSLSLSSSDRRALVSYLNAYRSEHSVPLSMK